MDTNADLLHPSAVRNTLVVVIILALVVGFGPRLWPAQEAPNNVPAMSVAFIREKYDELTILVAMRKVLRVKWALTLEDSPELQALFSKAEAQLSDIAKDTVALDAKIRELEALPEGRVSRHHLIAVLEDLCRNSERVSAVSREFTVGVDNMCNGQS